jgi:hypothetical protein
MKLIRAALLFLALVAGAAAAWLLSQTLLPASVIADWLASVSATITYANRESPYLIRTYALVFAILAAWAIKQLLIRGIAQVGSGADVTSRPVFRTAQFIAAVAAVFLVSYAAVTYIAGRETFATAIGRGTGRYYAITPEGIQFFNAPGQDPKYGVPLQEVTPDVAINLQRAPRERVPRRIPLSGASSLVFFDSVTGEALVWYQTAPTGEVELFSGPGIHPAYGTVLRPVTRVFVSNLLRTLNANAPDSETPAADSEASTADRGLTFERRTIGGTQRVFRLGGGSAAALTDPLPAPELIVLAVDEYGRIDPAMTSALATAVKADGGFLHNAFAANQVFKQALEGDRAALERLGINQSTRLVVLVSTKGAIDSASGAPAPSVMSASGRVFHPSARFESYAVRAQVPLAGRNAAAWTNARSELTNAVIAQIR